MSQLKPSGRPDRGYGPYSEKHSLSTTPLDIGMLL